MGTVSEQVTKLTHRIRTRKLRALDDFTTFKEQHAVPSPVMAAGEKLNNMLEGLFARNPVIHYIPTNAPMTPAALPMGKGKEATVVI